MPGPLASVQARPQELVAARALSAPPVLSHVMVLISVEYRTPAWEGAVLSRTVQL